MSYKKVLSKPVPPTPTKQASTTTRQEIDVHLKQLAQLVEKNPKKAAEVFKTWLDKPSKVVKPKKAA
jgi:flagellar biosynthesis/type III secretory pathway M-ring protein FliF/YscJ